MSGSGELRPRSRGLLFGTVALAVTALAFAIRTPGAMRNYREMFEAFGSKISPLTDFVLGLENVWWIFAAAATALLIWVGLRPEVAPRDRRVQFILLISIIVLMGGSYAVLAYAVYTEIFRLGATV